MISTVILMIGAFVLGCINFGGAARYYNEKKYIPFGCDLMLGLLMVFIFFRNYIIVALG